MRLGPYNDVPKRTLKLSALQLTHLRYVFITHIFLAIYVRHGYHILLVYAILETI
jgi:hypothetical protein